MTNLLKSLSFMSLLLAGVLTTKAQGAIYISHTVDALPIREKDYVFEEGSAYLHEGWADGEARLSDGKWYKSMKLKYDQLEDKLMFRSEKGETMAFVLEVKEFKISYIANNLPYDLRFANGFEAIDGANERSFYQVLADGKYVLLKRTSKKVYETKEYSSANTTKEIRDSYSYYMPIAGSKKLTKLKRDKSLFPLLSSKPTALELFVKEKSIDLKTDQGLSELFVFANALKD